MQTELSFLLDLLLEQKLPTALREKLVARIKEVEKYLVCNQVTIPSILQPSAPSVTKSSQAPSTLALMAKHGDIPSSFVPPAQPMAPVIATPELTPVEAAAREATMNLLKNKHRPLEVRK